MRGNLPRVEVGRKKLFSTEATSSLSGEATELC